MARRKATEAASAPVAGEVLSEADRITRLEEAVNKQLDHILQTEVTDLAARIRDIKAAMDMVRAIRAESAGKSGDTSVEISFLE